MAASKDQRCAVCGYILDTFRPADGGPVEWIHQLSRPDLDDHPIVPVDRDVIVGRNKCDFCGLEDGTPWLVLADDFIQWMSVDGSIGNASRGHWAACDPCKGLIARKRWTQLFQRTTAVLVQAGGRNFEGRRAVTLAMWSRLEAHMNGIVPFAEERV